MNLLQETIEILKNNNLELSDIEWIGSRMVHIDLKKVSLEEILNIEYNDDYGGQEIASDLLICGEDWWLERHEYDGSEWWEFKKTPVKPKRKTSLCKVKSRRKWQSFCEQNGLRIE